MTAPQAVAAQTRVAAAVHAMRTHRSQLTLATDLAATVVGLVALEDLLEEVIGEFDDETDQAAALDTRQPAGPVHR